MLLTALFTALPPLCLLVAQHSALPTAPLQDPPGPFGVDLHLASGENLLSYAWDNGARVPYLALDSMPHIPFGERGLSSSTRLYLPGNSWLEGTASGASTLEQRALTLVDGRYGKALGFGPSSFLRVALPPQAAGVNGWTLSFWIRPESGAFGRACVRLPGAAEIVLGSDGRARARLLPSGGELVHSTPLSLGEWSFVVLSYDPLFTHQMRFVVAALPANFTLSASAPTRIAAELWAGDLGQNARGFVGAIEELALEALPLSSGEALRAGTRRLFAGNHTLELLTNYGVRSAALAAYPTRALTLDTDADFALGQLQGTEVQNGELRWVPGWWSDLQPRGTPPPRTAHPTVYVGAQRLLTFGGEVRDTHLWPAFNTDDTWLYDGARNAWQRVPTPTAPAPRCHVPMAYSPDDDLVLLVGGWRNDVTPDIDYDDTWVFHLAARRWEQRFPAGDVVGTGSGYGLVYLPALRRFLLVRNSQNMLYDPRANTWQRLPVSSAVTAGGQPTSYRPGISPLCALDPGTGWVAIFGGVYGQVNPTFSDETVLYDVQANRYTVLAPPVRPSPRVRSGFAFDPKSRHFVLFGGVQDQFSARHDDLWVLDPRAGHWSEVACANRPSPRGGYYGMAYDEVADRFVLFDGRSSRDLWVDETLALEFARGRSGTALYTFDRLEDWKARTWFADVLTPGNSSVRFLFRASDSTSGWSPWRSSVVRFAHQRYIQVVAFLTPGSNGAVPSIQRMGLR